MQKHIIFYDLYEIQKSNGILMKGFRLFHRPKSFPLENPKLTYEIHQNEDSREIKLIVTSKHIALYVFIESDNIDFIASDNYFSMKPNESRTIILSDINPVNSEKEVRVEEIIDKIYVKSLFDLLN